MITIVHKLDGSRHVDDDGRYIGYGPGMYVSGRHPPNYPVPAIRYECDIDYDAPPNGGPYICIWRNFDSKLYNLEKNWE